VITISVESDEEQWAIGTALVNGAIGFGNWPFQVKRRHSAGTVAGGRDGSAYATGPDYFVCPLRTCCATARDAGHLQDCEAAAG
jgi:hypothetical protein